ncbi:somatomedin-B and thrombospondin type-1 domain-containing protein isoform X1 [Electrophorus electricus]|uniref:somatomedin-B and thrombospondin type-1 domain-containing protein isoform X1 n=1 Tax=Electrophorus electricus TaxID=8005 RepID=UPI0015CFC654|nr:somatomedin-B and thrombospondin type-1 domain-containing protein isoform X1 [Electrophorus electricus]
MGAHGCVFRRYWIAIYSVLVCFSKVCIPGAEAGCEERKSPNCCTGRNNDCFEYTKRKSVCYCDAYCQKTGDCCEDYRQECQISAAVDCTVGQWSAWSRCSSVCGVGNMERNRQVTTHPRNGGVPCPDLKQRRGCLAHMETCSAAKDVAKILPDSFKRNFKDPWRRPHMLLKEERKSYCVYMRVKQGSAACRLKMWSTQLTRERSVCVECQGDAMATDNRCHGDGLQTIRTFWAAATAPGCYGSWIRESSNENCQCPPYSILFV